MNESAVFDRTFNAARKAQGFRDQAQLDAFYRSYDHTQTCTTCQQPGQDVWVFDCWQPTMKRCAEAKRLQELYA